MHSAVKGENTANLMRRIRKLVNALPPTDDLFDGEAMKELDAPVAEDTGFDIVTDPKYPGQFRVTGTRLVQIARMTIWDYYEAVQRFQRIMQAMGVNDALKERGAQDGDLIMVDEYDFEYRCVLAREEVDMVTRPTVSGMHITAGRSSSLRAFTVDQVIIS